MTFRDLDEVFDDSLRLPIGGKTYVVPPADARLGLYCQRLLAAGIDAHAGRTPVFPTQLDDAQELDLYQRCLGPVYNELVADGVTWPKIRHAGTTAYLWTAGDKELA